MFVWLVVGGGNRRLQKEIVPFVEGLPFSVAPIDHFLFSQDPCDGDEHGVYYSPDFIDPGGLFGAEVSPNRLWLKGTSRKHLWPKRYHDSITWWCVCDELETERIAENDPRNFLEALNESFRKHTGRDDGRASVSPSKML